MWSGYRQAGEGEGKQSDGWRSGHPGERPPASQADARSTVTLDHEKSYIKWGEGRRGEGATRAQKTEDGGGRGAKKRTTVTRGSGLPPHWLPRRWRSGLCQPGDALPRKMEGTAAGQGAGWLGEETRTSDLRTSRRGGKVYGRDAGWSTASHWGAGRGAPSPAPTEGSRDTRKVRVTFGSLVRWLEGCRPGLRGGIRTGRLGDPGRDRWVE